VRAAAALTSTLTTALRARATLTPMLEAMHGERLLRELELPLAFVLARIERTGIRLDAHHLQTIGSKVTEELARLELKCKELAGRDFNVGAPRQLEVILFDELKLPVVKKTKTARSTDHEVLEELAALHELPGAILEHRVLAKLKSTYIDALPRQVIAKTGRIHTDFRQAVAATGRLSSSDPNLQNIPIRSDTGRLIRDAFVPEPGFLLVAADYSQIELRVLAHLSHDPELLDAFRTAADVHTRTARALFSVDEAGVTREMRAQAKTVNFAVIYGQTQFALARNLRIDRARAGRYIEAFFTQYAGVKTFMDRVIEEARASGEVRTLAGRVRKLPDLTSGDRVRRQAAERVARNTPIQGTAADILKLAMLGIARALDKEHLRSRMLLTVHDEIVCEAPPEERDALERILREEMQNVLQLEVPLVVDIGWGATWGSTKS
jgi:DNA polymerase-1